MPRAIGANCHLLMFPEATYGTAPGGNRRRLPFLSCDLCTGVRADTMEIDFSPSGPATVTFGLMGQGSRAHSGWVRALLAARTPRPGAHTFVTCAGL
jgi:hypothetical protein